MDERRRETQKTDRVVVIKDNVATKTGIVAKKRTMLQQKTDKVADEMDNIAMKWSVLQSNMDFVATENWQ